MVDIQQSILDSMETLIVKEPLTAEKVHDETSRLLEEVRKHIEDVSNTLEELLKRVHK